jgi:hypothetical protein
MTETPKIMGPTARSTVVDGILIQIDQVWRRKKDGMRYEVVWMTDWRGSLRIQLRREGLPNLKRTHWIDVWNLPLLYERDETA